MNTLETARSWVQAGYSVIPIRHRDKRPAFDALRLTGQDHGSGWGEFKTRLPTDDELRLWFTGPRRNLGIVTGYAGLVVLDFDSMAAYQTWGLWVETQSAPIRAIEASSYKVLSRRGVHLYVQVAEPVTSYSVGAIDVKAQWGYVLAEGSIHPSGHLYTSMGETIPTIERLADVFPIEATPQPIQTQAVQITDPWESATRAVSAGGLDLRGIKARVSLQDVLGIQAGTSQWVCCPLHHDTIPSMRLYPDGHFFCFGCQRGGDIFDLYAALHNLTNREAMVALDGEDYP